MDPDLSFLSQTAKKAVISVPAVQANPGRAGYYRPWRFIPAEKSGTSRIVEYANTSKGLKIHLEVRQFPPDLISCQATGEGVVVTAKHPEKKDKIGKVSREFTRTYYIPDDIDMNSLSWKISKAGILKITMMKTPKIKGKDREATKKPSMRQKALEENKAESAGGEMATKVVKLQKE